LLLCVGCGGPRIVPNDRLAEIFHDIYLVNVYVSQSGLNVDSLNIYEPIFAARGYTSEDIQYTIGSFAKRKTARLSDVVEQASEMLRREAAAYRRRIEIRDTVALVARERFSEQVYDDSLIRARRVADTSRLRIVLGGIREGSYRVSYGYRVDSVDRNLSLRGDAWLVDSAGRRSGNNAHRLEREQRGVVSTTLSATGAHRQLVIMLGQYPDDLTAPNLTIDSLRVVWLPPGEEAVRRLERTWYGSGGVIDSLFNGGGSGQ
jgi:hypothetical protein